MARVSYPRRGEVYLVNFHPTVGSEIRKTRPAMIVQDDVANEHSPITIVAAITSKFGEEIYPTQVMIKKGEAGLTQDSVVLLNQVRSVDRVRLVRKFGKVSEATLRRVDFSIKISFGLIEF